MIRPVRLALPALAVLTLLSACSDDSAGTATLSGTSTGTDSSTTDPSTTDPTTGTTVTPTTSDSGTDSESGTTSDDTTTTTTDTSTTDTSTTDTSTTDTTTTDTTGPMPMCGDGQIDPGEECDDGAGNGPDQTCLEGCALNVCGDGFVGPDEGCDDGNLVDRDGCSSACVSELCGDGVVQADLGEECDDGNLAGEDGCSESCKLEACGDGVVQASLGEACDDGNLVSEDGCSDACALETCGDGVLQPGLGEACDDGNVVGGDGCSADCQPDVVSLCAPGTVSVLVNEGFEAGVFAPWTSNNGATTVTMNPHSGVWAAETNGNFYVQQTFAAVPVAQLTSANFWTWHVAADNPAMFVEWGYSDNTTGNTVYSNNQLDGWVQHDILPLLNGAKSIVRLTVWGYSGGQNLPDIARFDDFRLCKTP